MSNNEDMQGVGWHFIEASKENKEFLKHRLRGSRNESGDTPGLTVKLDEENSLKWDRRWFPISEPTHCSFTCSGFSSFRGHRAVIHDYSGFWKKYGWNDTEAESPVLWPPDAKSWLIEKDSDAGRDWGPEEKGTAEDEMAGWYHRLDGRESEWTLGVGDGQGGLGCCNSWGREELDTTEWLHWTEP